ncbi:MAG: endonuclease/exonuclease/phosphatase family protein [Alistipes sp.]|nr:endonuclease/exonuclease/phosphatase family protein [Alistipes sp.]
MRYSGKQRVMRIVGLHLGGIVGFGLLFFFLISWIVEFRPQPRYDVPVCGAAVEAYLPDTLTLLCWNIGYAGLGDNMDFFYDGGDQVRDRRARTEANLRQIIRTLQQVKADVILLQEVDRNSFRTYGISETAALSEALPDYCWSYAPNYRAWWVPIPLRDPIGRVDAGLMTLSRIAPQAAERWQYPSKFAFPERMFNLKRCLLSLHFVTRSGRMVQILNTHNTAYDAGGMRQAESRFLGRHLDSLAQSGVYAVTGGDWNQFPPAYEPSVAERENPYFTPERIDTSYFAPGFRFVADLCHPSLRYLDRPLKGAGAHGVESPTTTLTDFFLCSSGVEVLTVETLPLGFEASDHNPVVLRVVFHADAPACAAAEHVSNRGQVHVK